MIIYNGTCETKTDWEDNKARICAYQWKRYHFGLFKVWLGYEHYQLVNEHTTPHTIVRDDKGNPFFGRYLNQIEIKWGWR